MPLRPFVTMPNFNAVSAGGTATVDLPTSHTYRQLRLQYGTTTAGGATRANMETEIGEVRLKLNGKVQRVFSAAQLFNLNEYRGIGVDTGILPILFSEPWRRNELGEDALAWGMADVDTFQVEVDIVNNAGQTPTLVATAVVDDAPRNTGQIVKWRRFTIPVTAVGIVNVTTLPKFDAYYALYAFSTVINNVEVKIDQREVFDKITLADLTEYYAQAGFVVPTGVFPIDFSATGRVEDALALKDAAGAAVKDFRIDFDMSAATSFTLLTTTLGLRD